MTRIGNKNHFGDPLSNPSYSWDEVDPEDVSLMSMDPVARAKWYLHALQPLERKKAGARIIEELVEVVTRLGVERSQYKARLQVLAGQVRGLPGVKLPDWFDSDGVPR